MVDEEQNLVVHAMRLSNLLDLVLRRTASTVPPDADEIAEWHLWWERLQDGAGLPMTMPEKSMGAGRVF